MIEFVNTGPVYATQLNFFTGMMIISADGLKWGDNVKLDELALELQRLYNSYCCSNHALMGECVEALREVTDVLEILRRGHGVAVSCACYPALNNARDMLAKLSTGRK